MQIQYEQAPEGGIIARLGDQHVSVDPLVVIRGLSAEIDQLRKERDFLAAQVIDLTAKCDKLQRKVDEYESIVRRWRAGEDLRSEGCMHLFDDYGVCIRCGEDAEEWEAGCVEEIVTEALQWKSERDFMAQQVVDLVVKLEVAQAELHDLRIKQGLQT